MSDAIRLIVDGFLTLMDRTSLEELRAHRFRLRKQLQDRPKSWVNAGPAIQQFEEELGVIEAAIEKLRGQANPTLQ